MDRHFKMEQVSANTDLKQALGIHFFLGQEDTVDMPIPFIASSPQAKRIPQGLVSLAVVALVRSASGTQEPIESG